MSSPEAAIREAARSAFDLGLSEECSVPLGNAGRRWAWRFPGEGAPCGRDPESLPLRYRLCPMGHVVPFVDACDRRDCPTCWRKGWLRREARAMAADLFAESEARRARGLLSTVLHVSLSPPPSEWAKLDPGAVGSRRALRNFRRLRARAYRVARAAGVNGGRMVPHHSRCTERRRRRETVIPGFHFHVLGFGAVPPDAFKRTGWVVRNHGVRRAAREVVGTAEYILDHSSRAEVRPGISSEGKSGGLTLTVTAFGRLVSAVNIDSEGPFCELCEQCWPLDRWLDLEYIGQGPPPTEPCEVDWAKWRAYRLLPWVHDAPSDGRVWIDSVREREPSGELGSRISHRENRARRARFDTPALDGKP